MTSITIYHNPRCSKSREALKLLRDAGVEPTIIEYLQHPPTAAQLKKILKLLGKEPRDIMRRKEPEYKQQDLDNPKLSSADLINAMVKTPKLIERPIVLAQGKAVIGRPPELVLAFI